MPDLVRVAPVDEGRESEMGANTSDTFDAWRGMDPQTNRLRLDDWTGCAHDDACRLWNWVSDRSQYSLYQPNGYLL